MSSFLIIVIIVIIFACHHRHHYHRIIIIITIIIIIMSSSPSYDGACQRAGKTSLESIISLLISSMFPVCITRMHANDARSLRSSVLKE
jgi:hypothetical protein